MPSEPLEATTVERVPRCRWCRRPPADRLVCDSDPCGLGVYDVPGDCDICDGWHPDGECPERAGDDDGR